MTFAQFQATGRDCADLGAILRDDALEGRPGRLYGSGYYIEDTRGWTESERVLVKGRRWFTLIEDYAVSSNDLTVLERELYVFAYGGEVTPFPPLA
jgi:hypothetical protein